MSISQSTTIYIIPALFTFFVISDVLKMYLTKIEQFFPTCFYFYRVDIFLQCYFCFCVYDFELVELLTAVNALFWIDKQ